MLNFNISKVAYFRGVVGDCRLAAPTDFIRDISAGKLDSFLLECRTRLLNQGQPLVIKDKK